MTRDDINRLAQEAGFEYIAEADYWHPYFERFATLVAAAEREKVAKWMIERDYAAGHGDTIEDLLEELVREVKS